MNGQDGIALPGKFPIKFLDFFLQVLYNQNSNYQLLPLWGVAQSIGYPDCYRGGHFAEVAQW